MRCSRRLAAVALALALAGGAFLPAQAQQVTLTLAVLDAEPAPALLPGDTLDESLFVDADVRLSGSAPLRLNLYSFNIITARGVAIGPQSYNVVNALRSETLVGPAHDSGWLLFTIPRRDAGRLSLGYQLTLTDSCKSNCTIMVKAPGSFMPRDDPTWRYALAALGPLNDYLRDDALIAGSAQEAIDPPRAGGRAATGPDVAALRRGLATLHADHAAIDRVAAEGDGARALARDADGVCSAIERDLATALRQGAHVTWTTWYAGFSDDNRALGDLYQSWPGAYLKGGHF